MARGTRGRAAHGRFFKDEWLFGALYARGPLWTLAGVGMAALTFAYAGRFWHHLFWRPATAPALDAHPQRLPATMSGAVLLLAAVVLVWGIWLTPFADVARGAAAVHGPLPELSAAYHFDARAENVMALCAYALGAVVLGAGRWRGRRSSAGERRTAGRTLGHLGRLGAALAPAQLYEHLLRGVRRVSD